MEIGELPGKEHPKPKRASIQKPKRASIQKPKRASKNPKEHPKTQKSIQKPKRASKNPNYTVFVILNSKAKRCIFRDFVLIFLFVS